MSYDWNWFFSSFSQSAAALIGIIAAFIISRLLGLTEKINATASQFDNLVIEYNRIVKSIENRHFRWYTKQSVRYDSDLKDAVAKGEFNDLSQEEILKKIYEMNSSIYEVDDAVLEAFREISSKYRQSASRIPVPGGGSIVSPVSPVLDIPPSGLWDNLNEEKELINALEGDARALIEQFSQNQKDFNSFGDTVRPLKIIILVLMFAFPLTVIYPLHFMPVIANQDPILLFNPIEIMRMLFTLKSILLTVFFLVIEGIFWYFLLITRQLSVKLRNANSDHIEEYRNIKSYSDYFKSEP